MNKKVLIDLHNLKNLRKGFGQYALHLARELSNQQTQGIELTYLVPWQFYRKFGSHLNYRIIKPGDRRRKLEGNFDIFHGLTQLTPFDVKENNKARIFTIHDAIFAHFDRDNHTTKRLYRELQQRIDQADGIVFISMFTKNLVLNKFDIVDRLKTKVIYNGNPLPKHIKASLEPDSPTSGFLFSMGELRGYKNISSLIKMLQFLPESIKLVHAGRSKKAPKEELLKLAKSLRLEHRIRLLGSVSEKTRSKLYREALAYVHPSKVEGFGLPVVEALSVGLPVICSELTALPEVGGIAAAYWTHFEPEYMAEVVMQELDRFYADTHTNADINRAQANKFDWNEAAREYVSFYQEF
jgi:glycosyltransferase involved in cell wall biosynthesis